MQTTNRKPAARKALTPAQQLQAAIKNAQANHVRVIGHGTFKADGSKFFIVPSQSVPGMCHVVKVGEERLTCDCYYSAQKGRVCAHRAAVYLHLKAAAQANTPRGGLGARAPLSPARAAMTPAERRETALLSTDDAPFSIFKTERRYQTLEDECAARAGSAPSDYYQHAYR